jgi:hypothetical protein
LLAARVKKVVLYVNEAADFVASFLFNEFTAKRVLDPPQK